MRPPGTIRAAPGILAKSLPCAGNVHLMMHTESAHEGQTASLVALFGHSVATGRVLDGIEWFCPEIVNT